MEYTMEKVQKTIYLLWDRDIFCIDSGRCRSFLLEAGLCSGTLVFMENNVSGYNQVTLGM